MSGWSHELPPLPPRAQRVLVFVAMRAEAEPVARALGIAPGGAAMTTRSGATLELVVPGADAATGADRIGPVYAAWALTRAIAQRRPDVVVNLGTAGGFASEGLGIADLVVARDAAFHDARVALAGFDAVARAHARLSPSEPELATLARTLGARAGLVSTGSSLDATADELAAFARTRALAKDMELAALAAVCAVERVPLVALKAVTDLVDHHEAAHEVFLRNLRRTCTRLADAAPSLVDAACGG